MSGATAFYRVAIVSRPKESSCVGAEAGKEFGSQSPLREGFVNERASSRLADTVDVEPYDPRHELGADELRILYRREAQAKRRAEARPGLWIAVVI